MKQVTLYSDCSFNYTTRQGNYFAALEYNGKLKRISGAIEGESETGNRAIIYGLIEAVKLLKEPCQLMIITSTAVGFKKNRKSPNGDLIAILLNVIDEKGCVFDYSDISKNDIYRKTLCHSVRQ
jgi:hypothetical protein